MAAFFGMILQKMTVHFRGVRFRWRTAELSRLGWLSCLVRLGDLARLARLARLGPWIVPKNAARHGSWQSLATVER